MPWQPGQSGNPGGRGKGKPFQDALRLEAAAAANGQPCEAPKGSLRWNARQLLDRGDPVAIKELADRLDGRVPQAHEHAGAGGGPITTIDLTKATDEQLKAFEAVLGTVASASDGDAEAGESGDGAPGG